MSGGIENLKRDSINRPLIGIQALLKNRGEGPESPNRVKYTASYGLVAFASLSFVPCVSTPRRSQRSIFPSTDPNERI